MPDSGLLCDLMWSDPEADISGWAENDRGVSYTFGADVVGKFLKKHDYDLVVRAHQVVEDGYEFFADRQPEGSPPCTCSAQSAAREREFFTHGCSNSSRRSSIRRRA